MRITPKQAIDTLRHIRAEFDAPVPPMVFTVTHYACAWYGTGQHERRAYRERLFQASRGDRLGLSGKEFGQVFNGGGRPDTIARALRLAARHRLYSHAGTDGGAGLPPATGAKHVMDRYIGLDCTGFVGNWAVMNGLPGDPTGHVERAPLDWRDHCVPRTHVDEIEAGDLVIWCNGNHVAVVDRRDHDAGTGRAGRVARAALRVAESAAGGLQIGSWHIVQHADPIHGVAKRRTGGTLEFRSPFEVVAPNHHARLVENRAVFVGRLRRLP
jgi:hypothetical protein